jgi:hypothetical protein
LKNKGKKVKNRNCDSILYEKAVILSDSEESKATDYMKFTYLGEFNSFRSNIETEPPLHVLLPNK